MAKDLMSTPAKNTRLRKRYLSQQSKLNVSSVNPFSSEDALSEESAVLSDVQLRDKRCQRKIEAQQTVNARKQSYVKQWLRNSCSDGIVKSKFNLSAITPLQSCVAGSALNINKPDYVVVPLSRSVKSAPILTCLKGESGNWEPKDIYTGETESSVNEDLEVADNMSRPSRSAAKTAKLLLKLQHASENGDEHEDSFGQVGENSQLDEVSEANQWGRAELAQNQSIVTTEANSVNADNGDGEIQFRSEEARDHSSIASVMGKNSINFISQEDEKLKSQLEDATGHLSNANEQSQEGSIAEDGG